MMDYLDLAVQSVKDGGGDHCCRLEMRDDEMVGNLGLGLVGGVVGVVDEPSSYFVSWAQGPD